MLQEAKVSSLGLEQADTVPSASGFGGRGRWARKPLLLTASLGLAALVLVASNQKTQKQEAPPPAISTLAHLPAIDFINSGWISNPDASAKVEALSNSPEYYILGEYPTVTEGMSIANKDPDVAIALYLKGFIPWLNKQENNTHLGIVFVKQGDNTSDIKGVGTLYRLDVDSAFLSIGTIKNTTGLETDAATNLSARMASAVEYGRAYGQQATALDLPRLETLPANHPARIIFAYYLIQFRDGQLAPLFKVVVLNNMLILRGMASPA